MDNIIEAGVLPDFTPSYVVETMSVDGELKRKRYEHFDEAADHALSIKHHAVRIIREAVMTNWREVWDETERHRFWDDDILKYTACDELPGSVMIYEPGMGNKGMGDTCDILILAKCAHGERRVAQFDRAVIDKDVDAIAEMVKLGKYPVVSLVRREDAESIVLSSAELQEYEREMIGRQ